MSIPKEKLIIFKYEIEKEGNLMVNEPFEIEMPAGARMLSVQMQPQKFIGGTIPVLWAIVAEHAPKVMKKFWLLTTGCLLPKVPLNYIGTIQQRGGTLVLHLFEVLEDPGYIGGPVVGEVDPAKVIIKHPVMIKENRSEPESKEE
jgi:hypothetical protein